jgi:hypothetical protein
MSASQPRSAAPPGLECPGWRTWVSTTGRWWAVREAALTGQQVDAGCVRQLHAASLEGLSRRISDQEALAAAAAADISDWPPGWRGGRVRT